MIKVLMVASEAAPFAKTGGLADVVGSLPAALGAFDCEVAVLIPRYRGIDLSAARFGPRGERVYVIGLNQEFTR